MTEYVHQLNTWYGIHYPADDCGEILDIVKKHKRFAKLASEKAEVNLSGVTFSTTTNSDNDDTAEHGAIFIDEMSIIGDETELSDITNISLEPTEMIKLEKKYRGAVSDITKLYHIIVETYKKKKKPIGSLYLGWKVINCTWDDAESS